MIPDFDPCEASDVEEERASRAGVAILVVTAVLIGLVGLLFAAQGCSRNTPPPPSPWTYVDADAAAEIGDVGPTPTPCALACGRLGEVGCHPIADCTALCEDAVDADLLSHDQVECVIRAPNADAVRACHGGFCR